MIVLQVYGVELSDAETEVLKLPPKFAVYQNLIPEKCEQRVESMNAKLRYQISRENQEDRDSEQDDGTTVTPEEMAKFEKIAAKSTRQYDPDKKNRTCRGSE